MQIPKSGRQAMAAVHDTRMQLLLVPQDLGQARLFRWVLRDSFDLLGLERYLILLLTHPRNHVMFGCRILMTTARPPLEPVCYSS